MSAPQQQNPRALINQFCQRVKVAQPQYVTEAVPVESALNRFVCTLTIPPIDAEGQSLGQQVYLGEGTSKKAAQVRAGLFRKCGPTRRGASVHFLQICMACV